MANIPRFIVIKPVICETYACYEKGTDSGHLYCREKSLFNPFTKIELEQSKSNTNYYHLRFSHSNRYWAKCGGDDKWIVAVSKQPEEDTSEASCTLFAPTIDDKGVVRLTHVQSGKWVWTDSATTRLYLDEDDEASEGASFNCVDWDKLVKLPKRVIFKGGDNGMILTAVTYGQLPCLQFASSDGDDGYSAQEVWLHPDGHLRMKSEFHGKFWRRSSGGWILADSSGDDRDTLFWPVKVDDKTIALRNAGNNHLCSSVTAEGKASCLNAAAAAAAEEPNLAVEVLVVESYVHNVGFRNEDARAFDEQPFLAGSGTATNETDTLSTATIKIAYQVTNSFSFTHTYSLKIDAKTTFNTRIPTIVQGNIVHDHEPLDFIGTLAWGETVTQEKTQEASYTVEVPPKSRVKVNYVGTSGKCSVPFSYTQRDTRSADAKYVTTHHNDGIFYGAKQHSFRFEHSVEPL